MLHRNPAAITVTDVYRLFVFDPQLPVPDPDAQTGLVSLARAFGQRMADGAERSVADLFESAAAQE